MNILIEKFNTPFKTVPFNDIKRKDYLTGLEYAITEAKKEIASITSNPETPNWTNTILALEKSGKLVDQISTIFFNLNSAETDDKLQKLAQEISPKLSAYSNDILLNDKLFERIKYVYDHKDEITLSSEGSKLLEKTYKQFVRNGALLNDTDKEKLREIDKELSKASLTFGENVLAENNKYKLVLHNEADLKGLPQYAIDAARQLAKEADLKGKWLITLDYPSYIPFMTYAENRELRKELFLAFGSKGFKNDELDNQKIVKRIVELRLERAKLLGYASHCDFVLEERMAKSAQTVIEFLEKIKKAALPAGKKDIEELQAFAEKLGFKGKLERWDLSFYSEKLKKEKFNIDDEILKPYFKLENVVEGVFETARKLYGLQFETNKKIQVYHEDVTAYTVSNQEGEYIGVLYTDYFPRKGKRQGAWMTSYKGQSIEKGFNSRPHISIVCNFTKPVGDTPSLLTFNEVTTLFHEFGHALHGLLANTKYESLSGTNVFWDFVELPSQIFENWCYEKECLDLFAKHYQTGETIPTEYIERIKNSSNFQSGLATLRQLSSGLLDMSWHGLTKFDAELSVEAFEKKAVSGTDLFEKVPGTISSCSFSHIFQGGYSSGYYSYKWAEVLDAAAFEVFQEKGIFNKETANSFLENILSKGGTEHPMELFKRFAGKEPDEKPLLKRAGLI